MDDWTMPFCLTHLNGGRLIAPEMPPTVVLEGEFMGQRSIVLSLLGGIQADGPDPPLRET